MSYALPIVWVASASNALSLKSGTTEVITATLTRAVASGSAQCAQQRISDGVPPHAAGITSQLSKFQACGV
jgi:hypothetical protein